MNTLTHVKIYAPATLANLGPGFDVLGIAINEPGDYVIANKKEEPGLTFSLQSSEEKLPANHKNVAAHVANLMLEELQPPFGVSLVLQKKMPIGSGLGSSGASSAAAVMAINALLPHPLPKHELIRFAVEGEMLASGSPHADNVAPSILGGAVLIRSYKPLDIIQIPVKNNLFWVVAHPHLEIETITARSILPQSVPLADVVEQSGNLSGLIIGLLQGDDSLVGRSMQDCIIEPVRARLIPGFVAAKEAAMEAGALGFSISGSGPSVFAVTATEAIAKKVAAAIQTAFSQTAKTQCDMYISPINKEGAKIVEQSP